MGSILIWLGKIIIENLLAEYVKKKFKAGKTKIKTITNKIKP